jgi:hypothetical protein
MAYGLHRVQASNAPASRSLAEYSNCGSSVVMSVLGERDNCFAAEEVEIATAAEASAASDNVKLSADSQRTKSCCSLAGSAEQGNLFVLHDLAFVAGCTLKGR